jgi:hypothetical protein
MLRFLDPFVSLERMVALVYRSFGDRYKWKAAVVVLWSIQDERP